MNALYTTTGAQVSRGLSPNHFLRPFPADEQQQQAQRVLAQFQEHPDAWQRVPPILETSSSQNTKVSLHYRGDQGQADEQYIALQILEKLVQTRWKALPAEQQAGASVPQIGVDFVLTYRYPQLHRPGDRRRLVGRGDHA